MALSATLSETGNLMVLERRERLRETLAFEKPFKCTFAVAGPHARLAEPFVKQQLQASAAPMQHKILSKCFTSIFHSVPLATEGLRSR